MATDTTARAPRRRLKPARDQIASPVWGSFPGTPRPRSPLFHELLVLFECDFQGLANDVIAVAIEVRAIGLQLFEQFPIQLGLHAFTGSLHLLRNVGTHGRPPMYPGSFPVGLRVTSSGPWAGATPSRGHRPTRWL